MSDLNSHIIQQRLKLCATVKLSSEIPTQVKIMLEDEGFDYNALETKIMHASVLCFNRRIQGIGIRNKADGVEFYSSECEGEPITLLKNGTTAISYISKQKSDECCIFSTILDYLAFLTLKNTTYGSSYPKQCDALIISSPTNFIQTMLDAESYENSYCYISNTQSGEIMKRTLLERNPYAIDMSGTYKNFKSLYDYFKFLMCDSPNHIKHLM